MCLNGVKLRQMPYIIASVGQRCGRWGTNGMGRLIKAVLVLAILGFAALIAYAYLAEMTPVTGEMTVPVTLHAD